MKSDNMTDSVKSMMWRFLKRSLNDAASEQGMTDMIKRLERSVPDISAQYSTFKVDNAYLNAKIRNMHAFQMLLVERVMNGLKSATIADIGDSSGTHIQYIHDLYGAGRELRCLSVNSDKLAVQKIKDKGLEALHARAEDLQKHGVNADIFLCLETLEHLTDPCSFLFTLAHNTTAKYLIVTVPYLKRGRVGLHHIRHERRGPVCAENTHIFELSSHDWKLLAKHAGWTVVEEKIYWQYPRKSLMRAASCIWRRFDFEGFYGLILKRDHTWSGQYKDWRI